MIDRCAHVVSRFIRRTGADVLGNSGAECRVLKQCVTKGIEEKPPDILFEDRTDRLTTQIDDRQEPHIGVELEGGHRVGERARQC